MNSREFYQLVKMMRYAQKQFFSTKDSIEKKGWLATSKGYEKKIDDEIERVDKIIKQKGL